MKIDHNESKGISDVISVIEKALIANVVVNETDADYALHALKTDDIKTPEVAEVLAICRRLYNAGREVTPVTICDEASKDDGLRSFVAECIHFDGKDTSIQDICYRIKLRAIQERFKDNVGRVDLTDLTPESITEAAEELADLESVFSGNGDVRGPAALDEFTAHIIEGREPISTGIGDFDAYLGGGFERQTIVTIGAAPGIGKTSFVGQICEHMANNGANVLYLNLEMSRDQMLARSISRMGYRQYQNVDDVFFPSATEILRYKKLSDKQQEVVLSVMTQYRQNMADRITYNPGRNTTDIDEIMAKINSEARRNAKAGIPAPIVVIDYLQLLTSGGVSGDDKWTLSTKAFTALKNYAVKNDTIVFVVTANGRSANKAGDAGLSTGLGTSAIEYSADYHLGLSSEVDGFGDLVENDAEPTRKVTLRVNKNRHGASGKKIVLEMDKKHGYFTAAYNG